ncbi:MAG TPA: DUF445 family protein [Gemmatimonadaceae bacterium]|nr:DUF445 family protein [Gemmatimonadaceae bacterium]
MAQNAWLQFAVQVAIGTIAGGFSDTVAVWMLFRPRRKILGFQGAIPKNQVRLAKSVGKTVGERLLTPHDLLEEIKRSGLKDALDERLTAFLNDLLETERGPLRDMLSESSRPHVEEALSEAADAIADRIAGHVGSPAFADQARRFIERARAELDQRPVSQVLTDERRAELAERTAVWAEEFAASSDLETLVRGQLAQHLGTLLASDAPVMERVPAAVVRTVEGAVAAYLPMAVSGVGTMLQHPAARERIRSALHELFQRFVGDLQFYERVIARLIVTERTFDKVMDSIERDGVEQLATLLDDPTVRDEIARSVEEAITRFLHQPAAAVVGGAGSERAAALERAVGDYLLRVLRAEGTRRFLVDGVTRLLERVQARTWGELLGLVDDEMIAEWVVRAAASPRASDIIHDAAQQAVNRILERPIGKLGRWLPADAPARFARIMSPAIWNWIESQIPAVVERLHVQEMVERKVLNFDQDRLEQLIRGVIDRELRLIVRTGYVLGGLIAVALFGLTHLLGLAGL